MSDPQDRAEATDDDKLGGEYPPERPLAVNDPPDDRAVDSLEERERRLVPDAERSVDPEAEPVDEGEGILTDDEEREVPIPAEDAAMHTDLQP
jgi:hypothetical protein